MINKPRDRIFDELLNYVSIRYSPSLSALLKYLISAFETDTSVPATDLARLVFSDKADEEHGAMRTRAAIARLRDSLRRYFESASHGRAAPYEAKIEYFPREGYRLILSSRPPAIDRPQSGDVLQAGVISPASRPSLRVFLCHSSGDKERVRQLHRSLSKDGFAPWLDEEDLLPGQDWDMEIKKAVRNSEVVLICLSASSVTKEGFVQKEIRFALDVADEKPDGLIYLVPVRLEECSVPERLRKWQRVDLFKDNGHSRLVLSLQARLRQSHTDG